jgi:ABC-type multidrug transport system fused ATPase/permease subunit
MQLYGPLRRLGRVLGSVQSSAAAAERVIEFFRTEPSVRDAP